MPPTTSISAGTWVWGTAPAGEGTEGACLWLCVHSEEGKHSRVREPARTGKTARIAICRESFSSVCSVLRVVLVCPFFSFLKPLIPFLQQLSAFTNYLCVAELEEMGFKSGHCKDPRGKASGQAFFWREAGTNTQSWNAKEWLPQRPRTANSGDTRWQ